MTLNDVSNGNRDVFLDTANGSVIDGNGGATNITAGNATITAVNGSIGATSADVFLGTFDPVEVNLTGNLVATALTGAVAFSGTIAGTTTVNAITGFIQSAGNLDVSGAAFTVTNLALITAATLTVADAGLTVAGDLRIEAANVEAVTANNPVILGTAGSPVDRLLYRVTTANDEVVVVRAGDLDVETGTSVQLELRQNVQFTDLDRDLTSLDTNGTTAILNSVGAAVTQGNSTGYSRSCSEQRSDAESEFVAGWRRAVYADKTPITTSRHWQQVQTERSASRYEYTDRRYGLTAVPGCCCCRCADAGWKLGDLHRRGRWRSHHQSGCHREWQRNRNADCRRVRVAGGCCEFDVGQSHHHG